jgi:dTDP-4-dehydrorhamnose 3,5-epimerase
VRELGIAGVLLVEPPVFGDDRGAFVEAYRAEWLPTTRPMVQANHATRRAGTLVGLHHHLHQADYWYVVRGGLRAVVHDLRATSPTVGETVSVDLTCVPDDPVRRCLYIPPGVAHGFAALTDVDLVYLVDRPYDPDDELGLAWDDPEVGADWRIADPILSERDRANPRRRDLPAELHP